MIPHSLRARLPDVDPSTLRHLVILVILSLTVFVINFVQPLKGDGAVYADNVLRNRLDDISIHVGYYLLVYPFYWFLSLFKLPLDTIMTTISLVCGTGGICLSYFITKDLLNSTRIAFLSSVILLFSGNYFAHSIRAEIYVPQVFFILLSMLLLLRGYPALSGFSYAIGLLITPLSVFTAPVFLLICWIKKCRNSAILFSICCVLLYIPFVAYFYEDYFWGRRGLLKISGQIPFLPWISAMQISTYYLLKSFNILILSFPVGVLLSWHRDKRMFLLTSTAIVGHIYLMVKIQDGGAFLLPIYYFVSIVIAFGLDDIWEHRRFGLVSRAFMCVVVLGFVVMSLIIWMPDSGERNFKKMILDLQAGIENDPGVMVASWWDGVSYSFYTRNDLSEEVDQNARWMDEKWVTRERLQELIQRGKRIYVLEKYYPSRSARMFLGEKELEKRYRRKSLAARVGDMVLPSRLKTYYEGEGFLVYRVGEAGRRFPLGPIFDQS